MLGKLNFFRHRRRTIFTYWDGQKKRAVDPLVAWRQMWEDPECNPERDFGPATGVDERGQAVEYDPEAQDRVLAMARRMFGVQPWSEENKGLTISETIDLLWSFIRYMDRLKKKRAPSPTPSPPTESSSSEESTTPPESGSSSTSSGPKSDEPPYSSKRSVQL